MTNYNLTTENPNEGAQRMKKFPFAQIIFGVIMLLIGFSIGYIKCSIHENIRTSHEYDLYMQTMTGAKESLCRQDSIINALYDRIDSIQQKKRTRQ